MRHSRKPHLMRSLLAVSLVTARVAEGGSTQLPIPCAPGACGTTTSFAPPGTAARPNTVTAVQTGNTLTVNQTSNTAVLNWASFNISSDARVNFVQPGPTSVALNRIFQNSPSAIFGQLTANGQIYLINSNGFLFGSTATVNAAGLIASALGMTDSVFNAGILSPQVLSGTFGSKAALSGDVGVDGNVLPGGVSPNASITVQGGAQLSTPGGRLLLAAPQVQNSGSLSAPDGQVILAAGQNIYLQASTDPQLRGLIVEVDGNNAAAVNQLTTVTNTSSGSLSAARGNVTMVGLAVNQDGRISATTSVSANGSVRLEAGSNAQFQDASNGSTEIFSGTGGTLELGATSDIEVLPELASSATAVPDQTQLPSQITLLGQSVLMHGGKIVAPSGVLKVVAAADPGVGVVKDGNPDARIRIDAGTSIDLSGSSIERPMSDNLLAIQLRANEFADDPTQRNGPLRGQTVYVDARVGSPLISSAAFQAALGAVPQTVGQRTTAGGSASFMSEGDVVIQSGATVNVSGGQTLYDGGVLQTTLLVGGNHQLYDIGTANPLQSFSGVVNPTFTQTFDKWGVQEVVPTPGLSHYESSYVQGSSAGSISIAAPSLVLEGSFIGHAVSGVQQRTGTPVSGGQLIIGLPAGLNNATQLDFLAPGVEFVRETAPVVVADGSPLPPQTLQLTTDYLTNGGFTSTKIYSNGSVTVQPGVPLDIGAGGMLLIDAPRINILSNITVPGGTIALQNSVPAVTDGVDYSRVGIQIGSGVTLDVGGQWTNDLATSMVGAVSTAPVVVNAGSILLSPGSGNGLGGGAVGVDNSELVLGSDVTLRADGGAWLQSNGRIMGGAGGSISIVGAALGAALQTGVGDTIEGFGTQGAAGGSFSLTVPRISIATGSAWAPAQRVDDLAPAGGEAPGGVFSIGGALFSNFGFSTVDLTANGAVVDGAANRDVLTVTAGTNIAPLTPTLELLSSYEQQPTGSNLRSFSEVLDLPVGTRPATNVSLSVNPTANDPSLLLAGLLDVQKGASIVSDPGSTIELSGLGGIYVDGTLRSPAGTIVLATPTPSGTPDPGYLPDLRIELGSQAVVDASGTFVAAPPNDSNLILGSVLGGGTVELLANRGSVIIDQGSQIDIAGSSHLLDITTALSSGTYTRYTVPSAAGSLIIRAPESISLLGSIDAHAGSGNYGNPAAGSLEIDFTRSENFAFPTSGGGAPFPTTPRVIDLVGAVASNASTPDPASGVVQLGISNVQGYGFDSLRLEAGDEILFSSGAPLNLARQLILDSPSIAVAPGVSTSIATNYLMIGDTLPLASNAVASSGSGTFNAHAAEVDLVGSFVLQNVGAANLTSDGAINLRSVFSGTSQFGSLALDGNLTLSAAEVYPATGSAFSISTVHQPSDPASMVDTVSIMQTSAANGTPLSAAGSISIAADRIVNAGTLVAPFGSINLNALIELDLEPGSVTSVSGAGSLIPYGSTTLGGTVWSYTPSAGDSVTVTGVPGKSVALSAPLVNVASGATINLQGGGDVYAYEWVPGTGGTTDALGASAAAAGLYAVLPSLRGQFAPYDPQETPASGLGAGAEIYLSGGGGLAAGFYPLLPARDALLPGAFLVQVQPGYSNIVPNASASLLDGTPVIAGYLTFGTTGLHSGGYQGVAVWPGSYGQALAQYDISTGSSYFAALAAASGAVSPRSTADAGSLSIAVTSSLNFLGNVQGNLSSATGLGSMISVEAPQLEITASSGPGTSGTVSISSSVIDGWKAGELLLGGSSSADGSNIAVSANTVTVDAGAQLTANQVILVANQSIDVQSGAQVLSTSASSGGSAPKALPATQTITLSGSNAAGAAILAVSDLALPTVVRSGDLAGGATLAIESGATVGSLGAISLDAPGGITVAGNLQAKGANVSLASGSIGFGATTADALVIDSALQSQLEQASALRLASQSTIDIYSPVQLGASSASGSPTLQSLNLAASAIVDHDSTGPSIFGAQTLLLQGAPGGSNVAVTPAAGTDSLVFVANEIDLGAGVTTINGFRDTTLRAANVVVGQATGGLATGADMTIISPVLTAVTQTQTTLSTSGSFTLTSPQSSGALPTIPNDLGGAITLTANNIALSGNVYLPAGNFTAQSTEDISLSSVATIDTGGKLLAIDGKTYGSEGGLVTLTAGRNLALASGALVNVSGAGDAPAGAIMLTAGSNADLEAALTGHAGAGAVGGSFSVNAGALTQGLTPLAQTLAAGGFTSQQMIAVNSGDLVLASGAQMSANQIYLATDTGHVEVAGTLQASSADLRGSIGLFGGAGVTIDSTGTVHADTIGGAGIGGEIDLGTNTGTIVLMNGSVLSASGSSSGGQLIARTPIVGSDVGFTNQGAALQGFSQIFIEPIITAPISEAPTSADFAAIVASAESTISSIAPTVMARLNPTGALPLSVRGALDLTQSGSVTLTSSLDLFPLSAEGQALDVAFRVGGSLTVGSTGTPVTLSDGFFSDGQNLQLSPVASSSFRLIAGADLNSADSRATAAGSAANLTLGAGSIVRTGTGEIDLKASGDIVFSQPNSTGAQSALVYTAGINPAGSDGQPIPAEALANSNYVFNFPSQGGAIRVIAGGNILGSPVAQSVTDWQLRDGINLRPVQWGPELDLLSWNVTSLGGGDVQVQAGGFINQLSAAAADNNYQLRGMPSPVFTASGGLQVSAGGDIGSSQFYLADGSGLLRAGGAFSATQPVRGSATNVGSLLALDGAQLTLEARNGIVIDAIVNPTANTETLLSNTGRNVSYFFTYNNESSVSLQSTGGAVSLTAIPSHEAALLGDGANDLGDSGPVYPGILSARSLLSDVIMPQATMFSSPEGQLELVAGRDIVAPQPIFLSDAAAASVPSPIAPAGSPSALLAALQAPYSANIHLGDLQPALIVAGRDITSLSLTIPKAVEILAGRDIDNLGLQAENQNPNDLTLISAGRDLSDSQSAQSGTSAHIVVGGPGRLDVLAGRNINLGFSGGITTVGNTINANLPSSGADLTVIAGLGAAADHYDDFVANIIAPDPNNQKLLTAYVESLTGSSGLTFAQASADFSNLSADQQRPLIDQVFFDELSISGVQANNQPQLGYSLGYAAIDALFPNSRTAVSSGPSPYQGDISLTFSRIYTLSGGNIDIIAPGGLLNVGLANAPASLSVTKSPSQLGIVAQGAGNVNVYTQGDVDVNSSRIFTLGGGNILIWSDEGSIDAGRGSKSSVSAPPPQVLVDSSGNITVSYSGAVAGSGIRTIQVVPTVAAGDVNLVAPAGTVNAGDAGIGAAGNINIAAEHVIGLDNINFGGTATGVPAQVSNIGVTLAGAASTASSASNSSTAAVASNSEKEASASLAANAIAWLDVFVTGLGEESCKQEDIECLKRQKPGRP